MNSKKYTLVWLVWLVGVCIAAFFMMRDAKLPANITSPVIPTASTLFSVVPRSFDQLVYIQVDDALISTIENMDEWTAWLWQLIERVDSALVTAYTIGDIDHSLLFLEWDNIDIEELKMLGLIMQWASYEAEQLSSRLWMYGPQISLDRQKTMTQTLDGSSLIESYVQQFTAGNYNVWIVSRPTANTSLPFMNQFVDQLLYTTIMTRLDTERTIWSVLLQFADGVLQERSWIFAPVLEAYAWSDTVMYMEMYDILGFLWVDKEQFLQLIPIVFGQYGSVYSSLLSEAEYTSLRDGFAQNVWVFIAPNTESMFGLWWSLVFSNPDMYTFLQKLSPMRYTFFESFVWSGNVDMATNSWSVVYTTSAPLLWWSWSALVLAEIIQDDETAIVSILWWWLTTSWSAAQMPLYTDASSVVFRINTNNLWLLEQVMSPSMLTSGLQQWIVVGDVKQNIQESQLELEFSLFGE